MYFSISLSFTVFFIFFLSHFLLLQKRKEKLVALIFMPCIEYMIYQVICEENIYFIYLKVI